MKIAIRRGHNDKSIGARGIIKEEVEGLKVKDATIKYLKSQGHTVLDVSAPNIGVSEDLEYGVDLANDNKVDLFVSIHFNKAYNHYEGAIGSECWTHHFASKSNPIAKRIVDNLGALGFKNRGVKHSERLYELRMTNMSSIIVEVAFVEATKDVELYKRLGADKIGQAIAEGILGAKIDTTTPPKDDPIYRVKVDGTQVGAYREPKNVVKQLEENWGDVAKIEIERR